MIEISIILIIYLIRFIYNFLYICIYECFLKYNIVNIDMNIDSWINEFEQKMIIQRYSHNSIHYYKSAVRAFLQLAERSYSHPLEIKDEDIENYLLWKIKKHNIGASYQRLIVTSIDKFYLSMFNTQLNIKHLYPRTKNKSLPVYLTPYEMKRLMNSVNNLKHKCIVKLLYGCGLRLNELLHLKINKLNP